MTSSKKSSLKKVVPIIAAAAITVSGLAITSPVLAASSAQTAGAATPVTTPLPDEAAGSYTIGNVKAAANVRQGPGLDQKVIGTAKLGSTVKTTGKRTKVGSLVWKEVNFGNGKGWIASTKLTTAAPAVVNLPDEAPGKYTVTGLGSSALNVRQNPGVGQTILGTLANGTTIESTGKHAKVGTREWKQVKFKSGTGWVSTRYLTAAK